MKTVETTMMTHRKTLYMAYLCTTLTFSVNLGLCLSQNTYAQGQSTSSSSSSAPKSSLKRPVSRAANTSPKHLTPQQLRQQQWQEELRRQQWRQRYYQPRKRHWYDFLFGIFWWLLYSIWFWVILAVFGLPYLSVWLNKRRKLKNFIRARMAELANPIDAGARFQLGSMLLKQKKYRRALPYLEEAHQIQKKQNFLDPRLLDALADTLLARNEQDRAIALYKESLTLDSTGGQGEVFLQLGRAYQEKKEFETAESWLQKACQANRSLAEPVYRLSLHLHNQDKIEESRHLRNDFLKDAHTLPAFIRKRNRKWVMMMRVFQLSRWFFT